MRVTRETEYQRGLQEGREAAHQALERQRVAINAELQLARKETLQAATQLAQANAKLAYSLALMLTDKKPFGG